MDTEHKMSVNALLAKALSTNSEDEAVSTFLMARKRNKGAPYKADNSSVDEWKSKARKYYDAAVMLKADVKRLERSSQYNKAQAKKYYDLAQERYKIMRDLEKRILELENSEKRLDAHFWKASTMVVCLVFFLPFILAILIGTQ
jgi:hypothetical protein